MRRIRAHANAQLANPTDRSAANEGVGLVRTSARAPRQKQARAAAPFVHARRKFSTMTVSPAVMAARWTSQSESGTPVGAVENTAATRDEPERAANATPRRTRTDIPRSDSSAASMPPRSLKRSSPCSRVNSHGTAMESSGPLKESSGPVNGLGDEVSSVGLQPCIGLARACMNSYCPISGCEPLAWMCVHANVHRPCFTP